MLGTARSIAAGSISAHTCAIRRETDAVVCWGANFHGQTDVPPEVDGTLGTAIEVATNSNQSCAIQAGTHRVVCWGNDAQGQASPPDEVNGVLGTAATLSMNGMMSCAIQRASGETICWGTHASGGGAPPAELNGPDEWAVALSGGNNHTLAIVAVPEPSASLLLPIGAGALVATARRAQRSASETNRSDSTRLA